MHASRFFSFGCSFTRYHWPTWADIIGSEFSCHENWGQHGAGNNYIANSVIECLITRKISADDVVVVQWSSIMREDRYVKGRWVSVGNIYSPHQNIYDETFVKNLVDTRGCYIRDLALMYATKKLLDDCGCRYIFISMQDLDIDDLDRAAADLLGHYQDVLDTIRPSMFRTLFNNDWNSRPWINTNHRDYQDLQFLYSQCAGPEWPSLLDLIDSNVAHVPRDILSEIHDSQRWNWQGAMEKIKRFDPHPTPLEHLEYIDRVLELFPISRHTRELVAQIDHSVRQSSLIPESWQDQFGVTYPTRW